MSINVPQKNKGRPSTGQNPRVGVRLDRDIIDAIERFRSEEPDNPNTSQAIRRLLRESLEKLGYLEPPKV